NVASQQTVLWMRILDRLAGPNPPKIIVIDPRNTFTAAKADVHLRLKPGTNIAVLNGLIHLLIKNGNIDEDFIQNNTVGFKELEKQTAKWTPELVEKISAVPADLLIKAAKIIGTAKTLLSTALQGVYQSMQATAAALQVNNIQLIRGMIGKPGCGVYQMNGQPTSQNTRECGANADFILPAALWGEKTGCFTNADRTVHISHKAVEPPGEARSDLDIFLDFAHRMDLKDKDGAPLVKWKTPEETFEAWKQCSRGRPCDYSGMSYEKLSGSPGIQWPCKEEYPNGKERLYTDGIFNTGYDICE